MIKNLGNHKLKKVKEKNVQIIFESLKHLNKFQFNPEDELHINPAQHFKDNNYNFVEETFEFAPPVISDKVDDAFLQRINAINNQRHEEEEERVRQEISRRRTILKLCKIVIHKLKHHQKLFNIIHSQYITLLMKL